MRVLGDLVAPEHRSDQIALRQPGRTPATVNYDRLCVQSWKVAHLFRHRGARSGTVVGVADEQTRETVLAFVGAALLGASVRFGELAAWNRFDDPPSVIVGPTAALPPSSSDPGPARVGYGTPPSDPAVAHLERAAWSENPTPPPETVTPESPLLAGQPDRQAIDHASVVAAASRVVDRLDLSVGETVAVRASFSDPGAVVAGIVAPLVAGATIGFLDGSTAGDMAVAPPDKGVPESRVVHPDDVI